MTLTTGRRALLICAAVALVQLAAPQTRAAEPVRLAVDIPAQPVQDALSAFSRQTGLGVVYISDVVRRQKSHAVPAGLAATEALSTLLQGTGLRFEALTERSVRIVSAPPPVDTPTEPAEPERLADVLITGSHLGQAETKSALPLFSITQDAMTLGRVQTTQELLERITINQSFGSWNETMGLGNRLLGFTAASLRGLGSQRTLVLLDGERLAPYALSGGQAVDLSAIPLAALERVDVLKDGASAIYGTDAIGGVINFILRQNYQGTELNASSFLTEHGGANNGRINVTAGSGDPGSDGYNAFLLVDYFQQQQLDAAQRASTTTGYLPSLGLDRTSPNSFPANIFQPVGFGIDPRNPTIAYPGGATAQSCAPALSFPTSGYPYQCRFDPSHWVSTIPAVDKLSVVARLQRQLGAQQQLFAEAVYYEGTFAQQIAPAPVASNLYFTTRTLLPPSSPFYPAPFVASLPGGDPSRSLDVQYRTVELGPGVDRFTSELWHALLGLRGDLSGWAYELTGSYDANRQVDRYVSGFPMASDLVALLASGVINPFGFNTATAVQQMRATEFAGIAEDAHAADYGGAFRMHKQLLSMPAGALNVAFAVEGRRESLEEQYLNTQVFGGPPSLLLPETSRTVLASSAEVSVPITRTLESILALRHDHYSDFGSATNPKVSLRWLPLPAVALRAAYGTGFRVPTLSDLYLLPVPGLTTIFSDPLRCGITHLPTDCNLQFPSVTGGNRALSPETSRQWGAGLEVSPVNGLTASLDYFEVKVANVIDTLQANEIFADYALWGPTHVLRGPPDAQHPGLPGPIEQVIQDQINFGSIQTSGLDIDLRFMTPLRPLGQLAVALTGTYTFDYNRAGINSTLFPGGAGLRGPDGAIVRWRHELTFDWDYRVWGATLTQAFQDGYREPNLLPCDPNEACPYTRRVGSYSLLDVQGRYEGFRNITLALGIRNLLDTAPPVSNQTQEMQSGIDPTYADPRGRMYYVSFRYAVK
jgi:iron complex outermembrane receptor protein